MWSSSTKWRAYVQAITDAIARGECEKVVAARNVLVELAGEARPADLFAELDARHPELARVLVRPPNAGTLVAATPERLVALDGMNVSCDALAGSVARGAGDEAALLASAKDRGNAANAQGPARSLPGLLRGQLRVRAGRAWRTGHAHAR